MTHRIVGLGVCRCTEQKPGYCGRVADLPCPFCGKAFCRLCLQECEHDCLGAPDALEVEDREVELLALFAEAYIEAHSGDARYVT